MNWNVGVSLYTGQLLSGFFSLNFRGEKKNQFNSLMTKLLREASAGL